MTYNIAKEYIDNTKMFIEMFMKKYFQKQYISEISKQYIETYTEARFEDYGGNPNQRIFYRRIYSALQNKYEELITEIDEKENVFAEDMLEVYQYIFYIDNVRPLTMKLRDFTKLICEKRITKFGIEGDENLQNELYSMIKRYRDGKEQYIKKFESDDFELLIAKYLLVKNLYKVNLKYNFKIPYIFSDQVIDEVYHENVINEDRIIIEYIMLTIHIMKMIDEGRFDRLYLVDFPMTIFNKDQKKEQVLKIISHPAVQDKIRIKITSYEFNRHQEEIYELMKLGYKFVLEIDWSFEINMENIKKLSMFSYVIVSRKLKNLEEFDRYESELEEIRIDEG